MSRGTTVLGEGQRRRVLREYVASFNTAQPQQGLEQRIPESGTTLRLLRPEPGGTARAVPVLGGLHHTYQRAA